MPTKIEWATNQEREIARLTALSEQKDKEHKELIMEVVRKFPGPV